MGELDIQEEEIQIQKRIRFISANKRLKINKTVCLYNTSKESKQKTDAEVQIPQKAASLAYSQFTQTATAQLRSRSPSLPLSLQSVLA